MKYIPTKVRICCSMLYLDQWEVSKGKRPVMVWKVTKVKQHERLVGARGLDSPAFPFNRVMFLWERKK